MTLESILALRENSGTTDRWLDLLIEWAKETNKALLAHNNAIRLGGGPEHNYGFQRNTENE